MQVRVSARGFRSVAGTPLETILRGILSVRAVSRATAGGRWEATGHCSPDLAARAMMACPRHVVLTVETQEHVEDPTVVEMPITMAELVHP